MISVLTRCTLPEQQRQLSSQFPVPQGAPVASSFAYQTVAYQSNSDVFLPPRFLLILGRRTPLIGELFIFMFVLLWMSIRLASHTESTCSLLHPFHRFHLFWRRSCTSHRVHLFCGKPLEAVVGNFCFARDCSSLSLISSQVSVFCFPVDDR